MISEKIYAVTADMAAQILEAPCSVQYDLLLWLYNEDEDYIIPKENILLKVNRDEVETDPSFKQIIPYIVVGDIDGNVLHYRRKGSENRLRTQNSIGFGGHWKSNETLNECIQRELKEELNIQSFENLPIFPVGIIYTAKSDVDSVHLGLLYYAETISIKEILETASQNMEISELTSIPLNAMNTDVFYTLENWSKLAIDQIKCYMDFYKLTRYEGER